MSEVTNPPVDGRPVATSSAEIINPPLGADATAVSADSGVIANPSLDDRSSASAGAITNPVLDPPSAASDVGLTNPALDDPISDVELRFDAAIGQSGASAEIQPPLEEDLPTQPPPTIKKKPAAKRSRSKKE
jgi:hypothetical protein